MPGRAEAVVEAKDKAHGAIAGHPEVRTDRILWGLWGGEVRECVAVRMNKRRYALIAAENWNITEGQTDSRDLVPAEVGRWDSDAVGHLVFKKGQDSAGCRCREWVEAEALTLVSVEDREDLSDKAEDHASVEDVVSAVEAEIQ